MLLMINTSMKKLTEKSSICKVDDFFSGCSLIGRSHPVEPFSFTGARGIFDVCCLAHVALPSCQTECSYWAGERDLLSTVQVLCGKNVGFDVFSVWLYLFIYLVIALYCYILRTLSR